jgi:hypothetical protein
MLGSETIIDRMLPGSGFKNADGSLQWPGLRISYMPITVSAKPEAPVVVTVEDPYTFEEWLAAATPLLTSGPGLQLLIDRTRATAPSRDFVDGIVAFCEHYAPRIQRWRMAIVTSTDVGYGVARMIELSAEARRVNIRIHAFRDIVSARRWLTTSAGA